MEAALLFRIALGSSFRQSGFGARRIEMRTRTQTRAGAGIGIDGRLLSLMKMLMLAEMAGEGRGCRWLV